MKTLDVCGEPMDINLRNKKVAINRWEKTKQSYIGEKNGKLTIIALSDVKDGEGRPFYFCSCECGNIVLMRHAPMRTGRTASCGCTRIGKLPSESPNYNPDRELVLRRRKTHEWMVTIIRRTLGKSCSAIGERSFNILGYRRDDLIKRIESQFTPEMNWNNYGKYWEIDHIVPVCYFVRNNILDPKIINALTNLQPLERIANRCKNGNY